MVKGKRVNRGAGYGLEVPVEYFAYGHNRAVKFLENSVCIDIKLVNEMTNKCFKENAVIVYMRV